MRIGCDFVVCLQLWVALAVVLAGSNFMWLVFVCYLLLRTTRAMFTNVTYYEFLKK